jgi:hypothetical protein
MEMINKLLNMPDAENIGGKEILQALSVINNQLFITNMLLFGLRISNQATTAFVQLIYATVNHIDENSNELATYLQSIVDELSQIDSNTTFLVP